MTAVGCRALDVFDDVQRAPVPVHVLYPARGEGRAVTFGVWQAELAMNAELAADGPLPVVAISHGTGGTPWGYTAMASYLARAGFAVVLIEHTGNSRRDNSLGESIATLQNRPRHVIRALTAVFAALGPRVLPDRYAVLGHSFGGYTALALAGGRPMAMPDQTPDHIARPIEVEHDARVTACVLLAPALPWLIAPGALALVDVPILCRVGERDTDTPPFFIERVLAGLPPATPLDHAIVPNAGHFAWHGPLPVSVPPATFPPAHDPPAFDRLAYQAAFFPALAASLRGRF